MTTRGLPGARPSTPAGHAVSTPEDRARAGGLVIPDYTDPPYGVRYGRVKAFHRIGHLVELSGLTPEDRTGSQLHPGIVGIDVTVEEARVAARLTAVHTLGMIRAAVGSLNEVAALSRGLCFIACAPGFDRLHEVSEGASELFLEVFGDDIGTMGRASVGATSLSRNNCFELWLSFESRSNPPRK